MKEKKPHTYTQGILDKNNKNSNRTKYNPQSTWSIWLYRAHSSIFGITMDRIEKERVIGKTAHDKSKHTRNGLWRVANIYVEPAF